MGSTWGAQLPASSSGGRSSSSCRDCEGCEGTILQLLRQVLSPSHTADSDDSKSECAYLQVRSQALVYEANMHSNNHHTLPPPPP